VYGVYGILFGGLLWWFPYLYIWTILWAAVMLIPKRLPRPLVFILAHIAVTLHGLAFGTLYAPAQALMFGLDLEGTIAWIVAGLPFDALSAVGNAATGILILPLSDTLFALLRSRSP
jgi:hypothetical protein